MYLEDNKNISKRTQALISIVLSPFDKVKCIVEKIDNHHKYVYLEIDFKSTKKHSSLVFSSKKELHDFFRAYIQHLKTKPQFYKKIYHPPITIAGYKLECPRNKIITICNYKRADQHIDGFLLRWIEMKYGFTRYERN